MEVLRKINEIIEENKLNRAEILSEIEKISNEIIEIENSIKDTESSLVNKFSLAEKKQVFELNNDLQNKKNEKKFMFDILDSLEDRRLILSKEEAMSQYSEYLNKKYNLTESIDKVIAAKDAYINAVNELEAMANDIEKDNALLKGQLAQYTTLTEANDHLFRLVNYDNCAKAINELCNEKRELDDANRTLARVKVLSDRW